MTKKLLLGNEAIARGAWEAGTHVISSYPGTPSTEVTEYCANYKEMYTEWAVNEKVALEVSAGASVGGARTMCCMKHVGVNVAADPLFTASYTGVNGGMLLVCADDPGMHSSQNEQDSRMYARSAHVPMLEPASSQECKDFTKVAFDISEQFDVPVMLRTTTRIAHARSMVTLDERVDVPVRDYEKNSSKYVMMPAMARPRHVVVEARMKALAEYAGKSPLNHIVEGADGSNQLGIICSGTAYQYVREAMPEATILKLGIVHPLCREQIEAFAQSVERLIVIEELEPVIEEQIAAWGIAVSGKELTGRQGELSVTKVKQIFGKEAPATQSVVGLPGRPPVMCAGCPHRGPYTVLTKLRCHVTGDIGCYTLGALAPLNALDTTLCMGASVGMAQGITRARGTEFGQKTVAVIGDSTFLHSGVPSLISAAYNASPITLMILDNTITGMTGHQPNPNTGKDIHGDAALKIDLEQLCYGCGVKRVRKVDAFDLEALEQAVREELSADEPSVIIAHRPCALLNKKKLPAYEILESRCKHCMQCMKLSCPAINRKDGRVWIEKNQCVGCGMCVQTCKFSAIEKVSNESKDSANEKEGTQA